MGHSERIAIASWFDYLEHEYLDTYIRQSGAAIKLVVCDDAECTVIRDGLQALAEKGNFVYTYTDSAFVRTHGIDHIYRNIATQIKWKKSAKSVLHGLLETQGFQLQDGLYAEAIAAANRVHESEVRLAFRQAVSDAIYRDYGLCREFRLAAMALARALFEPSSQNIQLARDICLWMTGELDKIGVLRSTGIFKKISRSTARDMLCSLSRWLVKGDRAGIVSVVDIRQYLYDTRGTRVPNRMYYTPNACIEMYETLRQFIDSMDYMNYQFMVFMTAPEFLQDAKRGLRTYEALRLRLTEDVRDRNRPIITAPMVCLEH